MKKVLLFIPILGVAVFSSCGLSVGSRIRNYDSPLVLKISEFPAKGVIESNDFTFNIDVAREKKDETIYEYNVEIKSVYKGPSHLRTVEIGGCSLLFFKNRIVTGKNRFDLNEKLHTDSLVRIKMISSDIDALAIQYYMSAKE
jgi:hypothetical protein